MRKPPVFAVEKQKPRQCLCLWRKHKSDGMKQKNVLKNKNINVNKEYIDEKQTNTVLDDCSNSYCQYCYNLYKTN